MTDLTECERRGEHRWELDHSNRDNRMCYVCGVWCAGHDTDGHDLALLRAKCERLEAQNLALRNPPWLDRLLGALGWQGGTIHQALEAVRRLVEARPDDVPSYPMTRDRASTECEKLGEHAWRWLDSGGCCCYGCGLEIFGHEIDVERQRGGADLNLMRAKCERLEAANKRLENALVSRRGR